MGNGLLEVTGTIDLNQFWPSGISDADTVKVLLSGASAFHFRAFPGAAMKVTHVFDGATIRGKVSKPAINTKGMITVRLQGIDAPELHYRPIVPEVGGAKPTPAQRAAFNAVNGNFRQKLGETATSALLGFLAKAGSDSIQCVVRTAVDKPNDVFDTYGRFIGNIFVEVQGKEKNVNHWLCEMGWAFPAFYASMSEQEIKDLIKLSEKASTAKANIWKKVSSDLTVFDAELVFRPHGALDPAGDVGQVILPKLFRRRSTFGAAKLAGIIGVSFKAYLQGLQKPDVCYLTSDFLSQGVAAATHRRLDEFVSLASKFTVTPKDLVFQEANSQVISENGKPIEW